MVLQSQENWKATAFNHECGETCMHCAFAHSAMSSLTISKQSIGVASRADGFDGVDGILG